MSAGTLWTTATQSQGVRIRATAAYCGVDIKLVDGFEFGKTNKSAEYLAKFPLGKAPGLETPSGVCLSETTAILRYVASLSKNTKLLGTTIEEEAQVEQWMSFTTMEIVGYGYALMTYLNGHIPYTKPAEQYFREKLDRSFVYLEGHLHNQTYLIGERITVADINLAGVLKWLVSVVIDVPQRAKLPNIVRFLETIVNNSKLKPIFGDIEYCEKTKQYTPPAKPKKEPVAAAAAVAAPKEAAKPKAKPAEKDDDEEEEDYKEEPKAKNPLDALPKSDFNLEDWKRAYSNMDTRGAGGSLEWFYGKFDKAGYSIWRCDFKYNEELTKVFMSSNQIGGFFNRLEGSRKYLFGSMGVLGEENKSVISGVFVCRGPDYKGVVDVAPDWESYDYKEINLEDPKDKEFFEAALAWDLELDGKKWADGKNFK